MPTSIQTFKCNFCGKIHNTNYLATECEESHIKINELFVSNKNEKYVQNITWPTEVEILSSNPRSLNVTKKYRLAE